jgi:hypothetical protein
MLLGARLVLEKRLVSLLVAGTTRRCRRLDTFEDLEHAEPMTPTKARRFTGVLATLIGVTCGEAPGSSSQPYSRVEVLFAEAQAAAQEVLEDDLPENLKVRIATPEDVRRALLEENAKLHAGLLDDGWAERVSERTLAKYDADSNEALLSLSVLEQAARILQMPKLTSDGAVRALLVHEIAHADAENRYGAVRVIGSLSDLDAVRAFNAISEGYAQHVARRICDAQDWSDDLEIVSRAFVATPPSDLPEGTLPDLVVRERTARDFEMYVEGERFIAALERAGGSEAVERAFREPPSDPFLIYRPDWYLYPELRPETEHDLAAGLAGALEIVPATASDSFYESLTPALLRAELSNLRAEQIEPLFASLRGGRRVRLDAPKKAKGAAAVLTLLELDGVAKAGEFVRAVEENVRLRDVSLHHGEVFIFDTQYLSLESSGLSGFSARRHIGIAGEEHYAQMVVASRGRLVAEVVYLNRKGDLEELVKVAERALTLAGASSD